MLSGCKMRLILSTGSRLHKGMPYLESDQKWGLTVYFPTPSSKCEFRFLHLRGYPPGLNVPSIIGFTSAAMFRSLGVG
jgi:hypothetical protein